MRRTRCSFCRRPVGRIWLRCRVCGTRLAPWYLIALAGAVAALCALGLFIFRETVEYLPF